MPFDGILTNSIAEELNQRLLGGRIGRIHQITGDALVLQIRAAGENHRLLLSCNPSSARIHLTERQYENPSTPPLFCMLLRKHFSGGIIKGFITNGFERIITIKVDVTDELGDRSTKNIIIEIMGRHSNIVLTNKDNMIIDAMKHIGSNVNRVRELLPARLYMPPPAQEKLNPADETTITTLLNKAGQSARKIESYLLDNLQGFSPVLCREICFRAGIDESAPANKLTFRELSSITDELTQLMSFLSNHNMPTLVYDRSNSKPVDYHCVELRQYSWAEKTESISKAVESYYSQKNSLEFNMQRATNLRKIVTKLLEKSERRLAINLQTYEENKDFDRFRLFGELITANIYALSKGMEEATLVNYYSIDGQTVTVPLDKDRSPQKNAQDYFKKYNKSRTAFTYAANEIKLLKDEILYLESILFSIESCEAPQQLAEIRLELYEQGYIKSSVKTGKGKNKVQTVKIQPQSIISKDGYEILIGHNNKQNDKLTIKTARREDVWLHIKNFSGSHVVIRTEGKEVPDSTLIEAAEYAAYFSKARSSAKAEVDYTYVRNVKKPSGAKPGMVIYDNYYTLVVTPRKPDK